MLTASARERLAAWREAEARDDVPETVRSFARESASPKGTALLLHGAGGSPADFHFLATDLARHGVSSLCPLLPGHGRGDAGLGALRFESLARRALEAYDALAGSTAPGRSGAPYVVGQSVGAVLGARVAAERAPAGLVALAPALQPFVLRRVGTLLLAFLLRPRLAVHTLRWQTDVRRGIRGTAARLHEVRCPLLVLHSRDDDSVSARGARELVDAAGSERKELRWLDGQGHVLSIAPDRERVFGPVRAFLAASAAASAAAPDAAPTAGDRNGT